MTNPNIVIFMLDDVGPQGLDFYPNWYTPEFTSRELATPRMNNFAQGMGSRIYTKCMATPICWTTRTEAMTGYKTQELNMLVGVHNLLHAPDFPQCDSDPSKFIISELKTLGYNTGHFGKWHLTLSVQNCLHKPNELGFDDYWCTYDNPGEPSSSRYYNTHYTESNTVGQTHQIPPGEFSDDLAVDRAVSFIENSNETPFFMNVWPNLSHAPFIEVPGKPPRANDHQRHKDQINYADGLFGRVIDALTAAGKLDNTLIIVTSDNGGTHEAGGKKGQVVQKGVHVPFVMRWPGHITPGEDNRLIQVADIAPTVIAAAGGTLVRNYTRDLQPVFTDAPGNIHEYVTWQTFDRNWGIRNSKFSLRTHPGCKNNFAYCDPPELFNLDADQFEENPIDIASVSNNAKRQSLWQTFNQLKNNAIARGLVIVQ